MEPNFKKLRELILHIALSSEADPDFGKTKLYKILFYSDFNAFARFRQPITGAVYKRFPYGPLPPAAMELLNEMESDHSLAIARREHFGMIQERPVALLEPDLSEFSGTEIDIVARMIKFLWGKNASDVSDLSHHFVGWRIAKEYEVIPYETVMIDNSPWTSEEEAYGDRLAESGRLRVPAATNPRV
jgi:hypothetical protein